jgi:hypothetical protein
MSPSSASLNTVKKAFFHPENGDNMFPETSDDIQKLNGVIFQKD